MSEPGYSPRPPEDEALPVGKLVLIAAVTLGIFGLAVWGVYGLSRQGPDGSVPDTLGEAEIGRVEQRPFALEPTAEQLTHDAKGVLGSAGWVDREKGLARMPIEVAVDQLVAAQKKEARR